MTKYYKKLAFSYRFDIIIMHNYALLMTRSIQNRGQIGGIETLYMFCKDLYHKPYSKIKAEKEMKMKQQILIVEDNEINREMLGAILSDDYNVLEAENGQAALDILESNKGNIALILLDVMMPVMDGYTFLNIIKTDPVLSLIPVIVATQSDSEENEINALEHGATDFVSKPYRPQIIRHRIANLINLRETAAMVNQFKFDRLTGLYTKEFFYRTVRERLEKEPFKEFTLLCCNIENFRLYNDTFGRRAGDKLLKEAAAIFRKRVSEHSVCCRYTADRFLCLTD